MDNLPIELIHIIGNELNYFDQINFKSISQWFYEIGLFNRYLPGVVIIRKPNDLDYDYCRKNNIRYAVIRYSISLQAFKQIIRQNYKNWIINHISFDVYVQRRTNIIAGLYACDCKPDFKLKAIYKKIYFDGKPLNYKYCIQKCADIVRQDMFDCDIIEY